MDVEQIRKAIQEIEETDEKDLDFVNFFQSARGAYGLDCLLRYCLMPSGKGGRSGSIRYANIHSGMYNNPIYVKPEKMLKKLRECEKRRALLTKSDVLWCFYYLYHFEAFRNYNTKRLSLKMAVTCLWKSAVYTILEKAKR